MKQPIALLLVAGLVVGALLARAQSARPTALVQTIKAQRWQKRLLLIGAPTAANADLQQQQKLLAAVPNELHKRDFLVLALPYGQLSAADRQYWTQELKQSLTQFSVVLIGKDGGLKRTEAKPVPAADLFGTVDKMPMRRQEARRQKD